MQRVYNKLTSLATVIRSKTGKTDKLSLDEMATAIDSISIGDGCTHVYSEWIDQVDATCTETGTLGHYECTNCNRYFDADYTEIYDLSIPASEHTYESIVTEPTCTENGYTTHTCSNCGNTYKDSEVEARHSITQYGYNDTQHWDYCENCEHTENSVNHTVSNWTKQFSDDYTKCTLTGTCTICGKFATHTHFNLGGLPGDCFICNEVIQWPCQVCHKYPCVCEDPEPDNPEPDVPECQHTNTETINATEPTCTKAGYSGDTYCNDCKSTIKYGEEIPASHDIIEHDAKAATCTEVGWNAYDTCSRCDYTTYKEIPATGHDTESHDAQAATCTEIGWDAYVTCKNCDYTTYKEKPALGHTEVVDNAVEPTCTETGLTEGKHCSICNEVIAEQKTVDALNHKFIAGFCTRCYVSSEDLCEHEWSEIYVISEDIDTLIDVTKCTKCGFETLACNAYGHKYIEQERTDATCTTDGKIWWICNRNGCDEGYTDIITATGHTEVIDAATAATCSKTGLTEGKHCSVCDEVIIKQEVVPKTEHSWESTYYDNSRHTTKCSICKEEKEGDQWHSWEQGVCTECSYVCKHPYKNYKSDGASTSSTHTPSCGECGLELAQEQHTWGEWTRVYDELSGDVVEAYRKCELCHETQRCGVEVDHDWSVWDTVVQPTCTTTGSKSRWCKRCSAMETETISKKDHNTTFYRGKAATCTENGYTDYVACKNCTYSTMSIIKATGHDVGPNPYEYVEPTCGTAGRVVYKCKNCGETTYSATLDPTGNHSWGGWIPVYTDPGGIYDYSYRECKNCPATETKIDEALAD